jgi:TorA maturation chaperone TorD
MASTVSTAEFDRARSTVYELLAGAFDGEFGALQQAIASGRLADIARTLPGEFDIESLEADMDAEALALGYDNLFAVPGPHYVPPFASAHADEPEASFESDSPYHEEGRAGELYGEPARQMATLYDRVGFQPAVGEGIPDHLAAQLSFMAALARSKAENGAESEAVATREELAEIERDAIAQLAWVRPFAEQVAQTDRAEGFFATLSAFAAAFVTWDAAEHGVGSLDGD